MSWFNASRSIGWSVSLLTATVNRWRRKMKMRWSEAPDAQAVSGGRSGKEAVNIGAEARRIAGPGMRRGQRVVGPALWQEPLAVPHTVLQVQHTELRVVAQGSEAGARCDQIAGDVGGMLVGCHAEAIGE